LHQLTAGFDFEHRRESFIKLSDGFAELGYDKAGQAVWLESFDQCQNGSELELRRINGDVFFLDERRREFGLETKAQLVARITDGADNASQSFCRFAVCNPQKRKKAGKKAIPARESMSQVLSRPNL